MANEFKHKDPGAELTQAEFIAACGDGHIFACQATGDILYASSATVLKNLGKGAANTVLHMGGSCIPAWTASPSVTDLTIGGGCITLTGAATDIDLIDNNASALSFDASGKAGIIDIVTTNCSEGVTMSGTLGVTGVMTATGGIELSHATANTLTASSGVLSIEGNRVFHAGGTDIPVADGGTGASTFTANGILVGNGTSAVAVTATMATKGHVMIGDGSGVPTMLAVGTNCHVLTACSGEGTGVKWAAAASSCIVCDTSPVLGGSLDASCETILNIGAAGNDILATGVRVINGAACAPSISFTCDTDVGLYREGVNSMGVATGGAERFLFDGTQFHIGDNSSTLNQGLNINQGANDDIIVALKSSDVNHGVTGLAETDTFMAFSKLAAGSPGGKILTFGTGGESFLLTAINASDETAKTSSANAPIQIRVGLACGTSFVTPGSDANLVVIRNNAGGVTRFIWDVEGSAHADVEWTTYDDYCDIELLRGVQGAMTPCYAPTYKETFGRDMVYNLERYEDLKLVGKDSMHWETREDGRVQLRGMVNTTNMMMLHHSTIIQMADKFSDRLDGLETQLQALQGGCP